MLTPHRVLLPGCALLLAMAVGTVPAAGEEIAAAGFAVAKKYCYQCHGATFNGDSSLDVSSHAALIDPKKAYVVAGDLGKSNLWHRVEAGEMPPDTQPQPSPDERELLRQWVLAGSPMPSRQVREFVEWHTILQAIYNDLQQTPAETRPYIRYFTLTHLYNNPSVPDLDMRLYRAALAKACNSVSWEPDIYVPQPLDPEQTLFRIDMRRLGWTADKWAKILKRYPYGMKFDEVDDQRLVQLDEGIEKYAETPLCYLRADWFIVRCMRPPVYNDLLELPKTALELEKLLRVDVARDYREDRLRRAGFVESAVSAGNRVADRHPSAYGYYWKSYDFKKETTRGNIMRFPLGPVFDRHPHERLCFEQDGGEMIFGLPNGLQGYYLCDGKGNQLDEGPIDVVRDLTETSGAPIIVNGLSCMKCHRHGMINFKDTLRAGSAAEGEARRKLQTICPPDAEMQTFVDRDRNRFMQAVTICTAAFLQVGDDAQKPIQDFPEPIGTIASRYEQRLGLADVACECLTRDPALIKGGIAANSTLRRQGLGPLVNDEKIARREWENQDGIVSPAQVLMRELQIGTPLVVQ